MSLATDENKSDWDEDLDVDEQETVTPAPRVETVRAPVPAAPVAPVVFDDPSADEVSGKVSAKEKAKLNRAAYRRGAAKAVEIDGAGRVARTVLAELVGSTDDTVELTAAVLSAGRGLAQPLEDINELAAAIVDQPLAAGLTAIAWGPARLKGVWGVLHAVGELDTARVPAAEVKAALAIIEPVGSLSDEILSALNEAATLSARN